MDTKKQTVVTLLLTAFPHSHALPPMFLSCCLHPCERGVYYTMEGQLLKEAMEAEEVEVGVKRRRESGDRGESVVVRRCGGVWEDKFTGGSVVIAATSDTKQEEEKEEEEGNGDAWEMQSKRKKRKKIKKKSKVKQKDGIANGKNSFRRLRSKLRSKKEKKEEELFTARMVEEERQLVFQVGSGLPPVKEVVLVEPEGRPKGGGGGGGGGGGKSPIPPTEENLKETKEEVSLKTNWKHHNIQEGEEGRGDADRDSSDYVDAAEVRKGLSVR